MVIALKSYLSEKKTATLKELCLYLQQSPDTVRQILSFWLMKGCVLAVTSESPCSTCTGCSKGATTESYQWI
jgi:hypothetical protein